MKIHTLGYSQVIDTSWRGLMAAVIAQAVRDLKCSDPATALDALLFLTGDDFPLWAEAIGAPDFDGFQLVISEHIHKTKTIRMM